MLVCVPHTRRGVVALKSAGLDPDPSSAQSVTWDDPQVAAAGNGGDCLPLGKINEAAFRKLPCKYVFLPVSLSSEEAPRHQNFLWV